MHRCRVLFYTKTTTNSITQDQQSGWSFVIQKTGQMIRPKTVNPWVESYTPKIT